MTTLEKVLSNIANNPMEEKYRKVKLGNAAFQKRFRDIARHKHRYDVFRDFVTMAACSLHNGVWKDEVRETEYLEIIGRYDRDDQLAFPELMAGLVAMLQPEPRDVLGPLYMELEIANRDQGQFFTPPELSEVMARMVFADQLRMLESQPFITVQEPACGAGGMVLAIVKTLIADGRNPARTLWVQAIDVDRLAALMAYVQLSLWHVPAEILVGNTLSWEFRERWLTPAHRLGHWSARLLSRSEEPVRETTSVAAIPADNPLSAGAPDQMAFDFGGGTS